MKIKYVIIVLIISSLLLLAIDTSQANQKKYVGRVSELQVNSGITCNGKSLNLYDGVGESEILVVPGKSLLRLLFYSDNHEETINGPCTFRATKKGSVLVKGSKSCIKITRETPQFAIPSNPSESGRSIAAGVSGRFAPPPMEYKAPTRVIANLAEGSLRPTFTWKAPDLPDAQYYRIVVNEMGKSRSHEIINSVITTNSFTVPDSLPPLMPGTKYRCVVYAYEHNPENPAYRNKERNIIESNKQDPYEFVIPSKEVLTFFQEQQAKIDSLPKGSAEWTSLGLSLLSMYLDYGIYDKARLLADEFQARTPNQFFVTIMGLYPKKK